jgi:hypothetical protein
MSYSYAQFLSSPQFEGKPMWQSYLPEAKAAVEAAIPHLKDM